MSYNLQFINVAVYIQHLQKHAATVVITYYVLLIKAFKVHRNFNILIIFILSFVFLHVLSSPLLTSLSEPSFDGRFAHQNLNYDDKNNNNNNNNSIYRIYPLFREVVTPRGR